MNQYLKSAVERYKAKKGTKIHPISELDAEIMVEIMEILRKEGLDDIKDILSSYKFLKDEDIRDRLTQWNIDNPDNIDEEDEAEDKRKDAILIGGYIIPLAYFYSIRLDYDNNRVIVNPSTSQTNKNPYSNIVIDGIEDFDEVENNIRRKLNILVIY